MKKITLLLACLLLFPVMLSAREFARLTRYDGHAITGVSASNRFSVELKKSDVPKAVVEIDTQLEEFLKFELRSNGTIVVDLNIPKARQREFDNVSNWWKNRTLKLTVYLPECQFIKLSEMARLTSTDTFRSAEVKIEVEDLAKINGLKLEAGTVRIKTQELSGVNVEVFSDILTVKAEDMSKVTLRGEVRETKAEAQEMARINGNDLRSEQAKMKAEDMARVSLYVTDYVHARSSDMASVNYKGNPQSVDLKTPRRTVYSVAK